MHDTPPYLKRKFDDLTTAAVSDLTGADLFSSAPPSTTTLDPSKRSKTDNDVKAQYPIPKISPSVVSYGHHQSAASKKIVIPSGRVGCIIGKGGETIKYIKLQSRAKIKITRDSDTDPNFPTWTVELKGAPHAIAAAEKLISEVLPEAEAGGAGVVTRQAGHVEYVLKIPNSEVGRVIGKRGETIKNIQASSGARIQVIPLHLPLGDTSTERILNIEGTVEQIESAKQLVSQVISGENRFRNPATTGGYPQQGYQAQPPTTWAPPGAPAQQPSYGYAQPRAYSSPISQYNMPRQQYAGYPPRPTRGYSTGWDQSTAPPLQQSTHGVGYDNYSQQPHQHPQNPGSVVAPGDGAAYNYSQPPASGYSQLGQGYAQVRYGGYHAPPQGYGSAPSYGNGNNSAQEGLARNYGSQADSTQVPSVKPSATQQGYDSGQQPSPHAANYPPPGTAQPSYGVPPTSQAFYGSQPEMPSGYGSQQSQNPGATPPVYGQSQLPKTMARSSGQSGYPPSQPPPSGYGAAYGPTSYRVASGGQPGYGQALPSYGNGYAQPPVYGSEGNAGSNGSYEGAPTQTPQQGTVAKTLPPQR